MLLKSFLLAILFLSVNVSASAFDVATFKSLNKHSEKSAEAFLALPNAEAKSIALKHVQLRKKRQTNYTWQVFLLAFLSQQDLTTEQWKELKNKSLIASLKKKKSYKRVARIIKKLDKQDDETSAICFSVLKMKPSYEKKYSTEALQKQKSSQIAIFENIQKACIPQLKEIIDDENVFAWYLDTLSKDTYSKEVLALFKQSSFTDRLIFKQRQGASFSVLSKPQQKALINAWLPYFVGKKENVVFSPNALSRTLKSNKDDTFRDKFIAELDQDISADTPKTEKLAKALEGLVRIESEKSFELFLRLMWESSKDKADISLFKDALKEVYGNNSIKNFPEALHEVANKRILKNKDIRFADLYLYLMTNAEGGEWQEEHLDVIKSITKLAPTLAKDDETQGVLKHAYLLAAYIEYSVDSKKLVKTKKWLDKAEAIKAPVLSWYNHLTKTKDDSLDFSATFKGIKALHENKQLTELANWIEDESKPSKPFLDLPVELYELFTGEETQSRIFHKPENGHALILDIEGEIHYFNGYEVVASEMHQIQISRMIPGADANHSANDSRRKPKITSSTDEWILYAFKSLFKKDKNKSEVSPDGINHFAKNNLVATERLLFAKLEENKLNSYPDYMEYSQYGNQILLSADSYYEINQYVFTFADKNIPNEWMTRLKKTAPTEFQKADLWYKATGSIDKHQHGIMVREYLDDNNDTQDIVMSAINVNTIFDENKNDCSEFKANELQQFQQDFNKQELELYKKGYVLNQIYHNEECVAKPKKPLINK